MVTCEVEIPRPPPPPPPLFSWNKTPAPPPPPHPGPPTPPKLPAPPIPFKLPSPKLPAKTVQVTPARSPTPPLPPKAPVEKLPEKKTVTTSQEDQIISSAEAYCSVRSKKSTNSRSLKFNETNIIINGKNNVTNNGGNYTEPQDDTGSIYSVYKQKIDSMFESDSSTNTRNSVQARIEKMFTEVVRDSGEEGTSPIAGSAVVAEGGRHSFSVDYMGSVPLSHKVGSLSGLQDPLRDLYFTYKRNSRDSQPPGGRLEISALGLKIQYEGDKGDMEQLNPFPTIAVWSAVKFVLHEERGKTTYAFLPLITDPDNIDKKTFFKPLTPADRIHVMRNSHSPLFAVVMRKSGVQKQLECHGFICQTSEDAIVIAATLYKSLMAHMKTKDKKPKNRYGVTCMSVASSSHYDTALKGEGSQAPSRPPRKKRSSSSSAGSDQADPLESSPISSAAESQPLVPSPKRILKPKSETVIQLTKKNPPPPPSKEDLDAIIPVTEQPSKSIQRSPIVPVKPLSPPPPRPMSKSPSPTNNLKDQDDRILLKPASLTNKWNTLMSNQQKKITAEIKQVISEGSHRGLQKTPVFLTPSASASLHRDKGEETYLSKVPEISGDILTKVTIPRSGSFLNAGGLTRYKSKVTRTNGQAAGGSPLGFNELFNEFRLQEGLHSVDEILGVIIDPEGMSFNDLKPIYKEFLLKLAVTLTKDELYQRSKAIMRRQKKKLIRRNSALHGNKGHIIVNKKFKSLKHIFQKSIKMKLAGKKKHQRFDLVSRKLSGKSNLPESSISTSSYDTRQFRPKITQSLSARNRQSYRKRSSDYLKNNSVRERMSTSEESDFFSMRKGKNSRGSYQVNGSTNGGNVSSNNNRNSSSGYVSCSECSYDSDTCTCVSADKCYCSLGNKNHTKRHKGRCKSGTIFPGRYAKKASSLDNMCCCEYQGSMSYCECDTDSCADSNKCYCPNGTFAPPTSTILEQLKQRGFMPSGGSVRRGKKKQSKNSPHKNRHNVNCEDILCDKRMFQQAQPLCNSYAGRARKSYNNDSLAVDYELFSTARRNAGFEGGSGYHGRPPFGTPILTKQSSLRSYSSNRYGGNAKGQGKTLRSTSVSAGACTEALSVKKSAEIAALFADIKLSQTTDITHLVPPPNLDKFRLHGGGNNRSAAAAAALEQKYSVPIKNAINAAGGGMHHHGGGIGPTNNKMYSAKNGLYTIQSQSDDSRRSSFCSSEPSRHKYEEKRVRTNIEDSLGYLP